MVTVLRKISGAVTVRNDWSDGRNFNGDGPGVRWFMNLRKVVEVPGRGLSGPER